MRRVADSPQNQNRCQGATANYKFFSVHSSLHHNPENSEYFCIVIIIA